MPRYHSNVGKLQIKTCFPSARRCQHGHPDCRIICRRFWAAESWCAVSAHIRIGDAAVGLAQLFELSLISFKRAILRALSIMANLTFVISSAERSQGPPLYKIKCSEHAPRSITSSISELDAERFSRLERGGAHGGVDSG